MWLCHFVNCHFSTILIVSVCAEQNLIYFVLLPCFNLFQLGNFFDFVSCNSFFSIFFPALVIGGFLKTFSGCCLGISKALLRPKQYGSGEECWRDNEEFVRHTGTYVVELGVGIGKGGESCRRKRNVEERRG